MKKTVILAASLSVLTLVGSTAILTGCGSGGTTVAANLAPTAAYAGSTLTSRVALANGQSGDLTLKLGTGNAATATMTITGPAARAQSRQTGGVIVIATPILSGTYDPSTGALNLTGSYTVNGQVYNISITGTLPVPPSTTGGSITVTVNGQSYTSTFGSLTAPTPTPGTTPTPSATPTPVATPSATPTPAATPTPGMRNQLVVTADNGGATNAQLSPLVEGEVTANFYPVTPGVNFVTVTIGEAVVGGVAGRSLAIDITTKDPLAPGTFPAIFTSPGFSFLGAYIDSNGVWQNDLGGGQSPQDGQIVIEQADAVKIRFRLINFLIVPFGTGSTGNLRLNGVVETTTAPTFSK